MVERELQPRLLLEALEHAREQVALTLGIEDDRAFLPRRDGGRIEFLDRDALARRGIARLVDDAESALPDDAQNPVPADLAADGKCMFGMGVHARLPRPGRANSKMLAER
jgi:hypothetical protein